MKYLTQFGELYRLTNANWERLCLDGLRDRQPQAWDVYGAKRAWLAAP